MFIDLLCMYIYVRIYVCMHISTYVCNISIRIVRTVFFFYFEINCLFALLAPILLTVAVQLTEFCYVAGKFKQSRRCMYLYYTHVYIYVRHV